VRSVNRVTLLGRLTGDPESRTSGAKPVCNFTIETSEVWMDRNGEQRREVLHDCVAFGPVAASVSSLVAGAHVYVEGALRTERDGGDGYAHEVVCFVAIPVAEPPEVLGREAVTTRSAAV
jgi:single-strand DNA-binding protein